MSTENIKSDAGYLNLKQTAEFLGVSRSTVYDWVEKGRLKPVLMVGRTWLFAEDHLQTVKASVEHTA